MSELKPCPFCGSHAMPVVNPANKAHSILCSWCQAEGGLRPTETEAIKAWNERTDPVKAQMLEALKEAQDKFDFLQDSFPKTLNKIDHAIEAAEKEVGDGIRK